MSSFINKSKVIDPEYYKDGGIEVIEYIKAKLSNEEFLGFCKGNVLKYMSRHGKKHTDNHDCDKAMYYLKKLKDNL